MSINKSMKKMHRISRLINDIRSSSKHTDSLVVQTGFPTSLIDLFVKHRNRFSKSSFSSSPNNIHNKNASPGRHPHQHRPLVEEIRSTSTSNPNLFAVASVSDSISDISDGNDVSIQKSRVVFMNVVKMFVILSFAFVTKRLAISVTFWAFLLLFLEHWFKSSHRNIRKAEIEIKERSACFCGNDSLIDDESKTDTKEILQFAPENQIEECKLSVSDHKNQEEEEGIEFVRLSGPNRMCRAKIRAKRFGKLVSNKFRTHGGIEYKEQQSLIAPVQ